MARAWADLMAQGRGSTTDSSRWLIEHLRQAEDVDRAMRSIAHQMKSARFPVHRDMVGFDFEASIMDILPGFGLHSPSALRSCTPNFDIPISVAGG